MQVRLLPGPPLEGLPQARYPVSKTGAASAVGGSTPSPSAFVPARSNGYDARLLIVKSRFEPCRRSSHRRSVSVAARLADTEQGLVRFQDLRSSSCPRGRAAVTPGSQPGSAGSSPAGGSSSGCGGDGHPAGFGNRRTLVRLQPARPRSTQTCPTTRGGGAAFLASLMSSRRGFESHPRNFGGVAQRSEHSLVRR